jgi:2-iminobutanoate/2-iminopropanoate deaminase
VAKPPATYSQAVKAAGLVFVSGTGPTDAETGAFKSATVQEQTRQCLANIAAILEEAGSSMQKTVSATGHPRQRRRLRGDERRMAQMVSHQSAPRQGAELPVRVEGLLVSIAAIAEA